MAAIVNDRDALILGTSPRYTAPTNMDLFLSPPSAIFKQSADLSTASPNSITFQATPLNLVGTVTFTASAGLTITVSGNTATLTYANFSAANGTITASMTVDGVTYTKVSTVTKLADGAQGTPGVGTPGTPGTQTAPVFLYQWNSSTPAAPTGTSTVTWPAATNSAYTGSDGWAVTAPANPGTPSLRLYVVTRTVTAAGTATSTTGVSYSGLTATAWTQNGATGPNGAPGVQSFSAEVYQWASTIPAGPVGSPTLNWGTRLFGAAPSGWSLAPGAPVLGATLWAAAAQVLDTAAATSTTFNWNTASIVARGYAGTNGTGMPGAEGVSSFTAYCASTTSAATSVPAATTGKASVPAANSGGIVGTWSRTAPTSLTTDQRIWEVDGTYNPATDQITYQFPYWSVWKVGSLSAITLGVMGNITAGSMDIGSGANSWHVDPNGNMWSGATTMAAAPFVVMNTGQLIATAATFKTADGTVLFSTGTGLTLAGGRVADVSNLIKKGTFDDGSSGGWNGFAVEAIGGTGSAAVPATKHFVTQSRDCTEIGNQIPVTAGETLYFSAWINTEATNFDCSFGIFIYNKNGTTDVNNIVQFASAVAVSKGSAWTFVQGSIVVAAGGAVGIPWLFQNGTDFVALNRARYAALWAGRAQRGATVGAPAGTFVAGVAAATVATAATNFNTSNDRNATAVVAPTVVTDGTAVDHTLRTDGAADVSFEWAWSGAEGDIDGFLVYVYRSPAGGAYTFGTSPAEEQVYTVPASKRAFIQFGTGANVYITFGVQAYRAVDKDINAAGVIKSAIVKSALAAENPYLPSTSVAFVGNVTGTINGIAAANVNVWSQVSGAGKPADNATVGATFGLGGNITGQMAVAQVPNFIPANGITDVLFGGNLKSTNWNGDTGVDGMGFLLERSTGYIYCGGLKGRGAVMGGNFTGYAWPANGGGGYYLGPEGLALGNNGPNGNGAFVDINSNGTVNMPGFSLVNKQLTLTNTILIAPKIGDNMIPSLSPTYFTLQRNANQQFTNVYAGNFTASMTNTTSAISYAWSISSESSEVIASLSGTTGSSAIAYVSGKLLSGQEVDITISCLMTSGGVSKSASAIITVQIP